MNEHRTCADKSTKSTQVGSPPVRGYVYFIQADEVIKIGYSLSPELRLGQLQVGSGQTLELIGIMDGTVMTERKIQKKFEHLRIRGEWFQATTELIEFIDSVRLKPVEPTPPPPPVSAENRQVIAGLINLRSAHGPDTSMGYVCSNLAEQIQNMAGYERPKWATHHCQTLPWMMKRQAAHLARLRADLQ